MVREIGSIDLRTQDAIVIPTSEPDNVVFPTQTKNRTVYRIVNTTDAYVEVSYDGTDTADDEFTDTINLNEGRPVPAGTVREMRYSGPYERLRFTVQATESAPTEGNVELRSVEDDSPNALQSETLSDFELLNQGKSYNTRYQEKLANDGDSVSLGIRNPDTADQSFYLRALAFPSGGDALITTEVDHDNYSDGATIALLNKRPELQVERDAEAAVTANPSFSGAQKSTEGFIPGGSGGSDLATPGTEGEGSDWEIDPGQDVVFTLTNDSGSTNRYGFLLQFAETVIR